MGLSLLVIAPRLEQRKVFETFFQLLPQKGGISGSVMLDSAKDIIGDSESPEFVFLSDELSQENREEFIFWVKARKGGRKTTFITICNGAKPDAGILASHLLEGAHAVIKEPVNFDKIEEVLKLGKGMKSRGTEIRLRTVAGLLLTDALDRVGLEKGLPIDSRDLESKVKGAFDTYQKFTGKSLTLESIRPGEKSADSSLPKYTGVSSRVREIHEARIRDLANSLISTPRM